jgi:AraC-like DNA-binding protein
MTDNFKYLIHNNEDESWGLYLTVAGDANIRPFSNYPVQGHPTGYHFNWEHGRVLREYQINYITEGEGLIETNEGTFPIREGSVILIRPNQWHRYKPVAQKGWKEHYIGFDGEFAARIMTGNALFASNNPVIHIGYHENLLRLFLDLWELVQVETPGYHQVCAGIIVQVLGHIVSFKRNRITGAGIDSAMQKACLILRENYDKNIEAEKLAIQLDMGYSLFRKAFKAYTGMSPVQYHLSLRVQQAVRLLTNTNLSIKEISFRLGFCSEYYFSRLFKEKTGKVPSEYRRKKR